MPTPAAILTDFARLLLMLRDSPDAREQVKEALRRFAADLGETDHVLALMPAGFRWDRFEVPLDRGEVATLYGHLKGHGVGEIRIPGGLATSALVALVRGLSVAPGTYSSFDHLIARLDAAGCGSIAVQPFGAAPVTAGARGLKTEPKPIVAIAIEVPSPKGFGGVRLRQVPDVTGPSQVSFVKDVVEVGSVVATDGWSGYPLVCARIPA